MIFLLIFLCVYVFVHFDVSNLYVMASYSDCVLCILSLLISWFPLHLYFYKMLSNQSLCIILFHFHDVLLILSSVKKKSSCIPGSLPVLHSLCLMIVYNWPILFFSLLRLFRISCSSFDDSDISKFLSNSSSSSSTLLYELVGVSCWVTALHGIL